MKVLARDEAAMAAFGQRLARAVEGAGIVYIQGDLGAGKTTLVRSLLRGLGYPGKVKSPTYTLVEPYPLEGMTVYHLDLYRLGSADELEWIGIRDLMSGSELLLVEWPERAEGALPPPDLLIRIDYCGTGRRLQLLAGSPRGREWLAALPDSTPDEAG